MDWTMITAFVATTVLFVIQISEYYNRKDEEETQRVFDIADGLYEDSDGDDWDWD